ncbi:oligosaccharide repeat unit polymerase [Olivibacter sp. SA151]|uniref:oligosaccharide repeat unit polymerase n=1 Tax=Olivibacter jilunii TaxID=985016 RepID=UPI003F13BF2E
MYYLVLALVVLIISAKIFKKAAGTLSLQKLNMISWIFYYNIFLQSFIAAILVVYKVDYHYFIGKMYSDQSRIYGYYAILYTMIALPAGMLLFNRLLSLPFTKVLFENYQAKELSFQFPVGDKSLRFCLLLLSIICIASIVYVFISLGGMPLLKALTGGASATDLAKVRSDASRGFEGIVYIRNIFGIILTPIISYIYYGYYKLTGSRYLRTCFIVMSLFSVVILTYNLEKSPLIEYIVGFLILKILLNDRIEFRTILRYFVIIIVLITLIYVFVLQENIEALVSYNSGFIGRIILGQSAGTYLSFDLFPKYRDFIGFSSISKQLSSLLGIEYSERAARLIMEFYNPKGIDEGSAGVVNSLFIAEAWANFGLIGVILSPIYVGFVIQLIYTFFLKKSKTPILVGVFGYLSYNLPVTGGINDFFYSVPIIAIFVVFSLMISWAKTLNNV